MSLTPAPASTRAGEIIPLTSIRGVAAVWVVLYHLWHAFERSVPFSLPSAVPNLIDGAPIAVDLFFMLSGYVITRTYGVRSDLGTFLLHRFARIYPMAVTVLLAMVAGIAAMDALGFTTSDPGYFSFRTLPFHLTLTFVWFDMPLGWNAPAWSVSAEVAVYLCFPLMQVGLRHLSPAVAAPIAVVLVLGLTALFVDIGFPNTGAPALLRAWLGFTAGALLQHCGRQVVLPSVLAPAALAAILILAACGLAPFAAPAAFLLVWCLGSPAEGGIHRLLSGSSVFWLGRTSYSFYLLHVPLIIVVVQFFRRLPFLQTGLGLLLLLASYAVLLLVLTGFASARIEYPARVMLRQAFRRTQRRGA